MDGSLAAATSLRMRNLLQRTYHQNSDDTNSALFEELFLGIPSPPEIEKSDDESVPIKEGESSAARKTDDSHATDTRNSDSDDQESTAPDENSSDLPLSLTQFVPIQNNPSPAQDVASPDGFAPTEKVTPAIGPDDSNAISGALAVDPKPALPSEAVTLESHRSVLQPAVTSGKEVALEKAVQAPLRAGRDDSRPRKVNQKPDAQPAKTSVVSSTPLIQNADGHEKQEAKSASHVSLEQISDKTDKSSDTKLVESTRRRDKWYLDESGIANDSGEIPFEEGASDRGPFERYTEPLPSDAANGVTATLTTTPSDALNSLSDASAAGASTAAQPVSSVDALPMAAVAAQAATAANNALSVNATIERSAGTPSIAPTGASTSMQPTGIGTNSGQERSPIAAGGQSESDVRQLSQQERVRLVQRVARSFSRLTPDGGQLTLKLHPPQLGALNLTVRMEGQTLSARMQTESVEARDALLDNLPILRERLADQGVQIDRFQVEVGTNSDQTANASAQGQNAFASDSQQNPWGRPSVDYRRIHNRSTEVPSLSRTEWATLGSPDWQSRVATDRTIDIRA